jgi:YVTN family beta-propeller protein
MVALFCLPALAVHLSVKIPIGNGNLTPALNSTARRLYLANLHGSLSVVDTSTNELVTTVTLPNPAVALDVNPVTNLVYVTGGVGTSAVNVINGADNTIVTTISVGQGPLGIAVNSVTDRIYTVNNTDKTMSVIDGSTNTVIDTVTLGDAGIFVVADSTKNMVYATSFTTVYAIDGNTDTVVNSMNLTSDAVGLAADPSRQRLYVADQTFSGTLTSIDTTTFTVSQTLSLASAGPLSIHPLNHAILTPSVSSGNNGIAVVNPDTFKQTGFIGKIVHTFYTGAVVDAASGNLYAPMQNGFTLNSGVFVFAP